MRAISMRRLFGGAAASLLLGAMVLGTAVPALAVVPQAQATNEALPAVVNGDVVAFRTTLDYTDGSTLSKAFVTLFTEGTGDRLYLSATRNGNPVANACGSTLPVSCTFKTVRTNDRLVVTAAFQRTLPTASGRGVWSSSGSTGSDGGTSHGDTWENVTATATYDASSPDYGGGFAVVAGATVGNGQAVSATNRQATKVTSLPLGVAATVQDGIALDSDCGPYVCGSVGEISLVSVGDGQSFGSPFQIVITLYQGTPKSFVHKYVDGAGATQYELVGTCPKQNPASGAPCFTWSAKNNAATIYTFHNGSWRSGS